MWAVISRNGHTHSSNCDSGGDLRTWPQPSALSAKEQKLILQQKLCYFVHLRSQKSVFLSSPAYRFMCVVSLSFHHPDQVITCQSLHTWRSRSSSPVERQMEIQSSVQSLSTTRPYTKPAKNIGLKFSTLYPLFFSLTTLQISFSLWDFSLRLVSEMKNKKSPWNKPLQSTAIRQSARQWRNTANCRR